MSNVREASGWKRTQEYKDVRWILKGALGTPDYTDHIKNGVSFKWYLDHRFRNRIPLNYEGRELDFIESLLGGFPVNVDVKFLGPPPMGSMILRGRSLGYDTFRILVRGR